jgi:hypothetical protein
VLVEQTHSTPFIIIPVLNACSNDHVTSEHHNIVAVLPFLTAVSNVTRILSFFPHLIEKIDGFLANRGGQVDTSGRNFRLNTGNFGGQHHNIHLPNPVSEMATFAKEWQINVIVDRKVPT